MYCINCGVKLADSEKQCPLCATPVFHPHLKQPEGERLYPLGEEPVQKVNPWGALFIVSLLFLLPGLITLLVDWQINQAVTWSGYVIGALMVGYACFVLPFWFRHPNPVIFVPIDFAVIILYLLYINLSLKGDWFLSFAFPVTGGVGLILTAVITLTRYLRRGKLYIFGGASILLGGFMMLTEFLLDLTFNRSRLMVWSVYPLTVLVLLGLALIFVAICKPLRESLERKFFI